MTDEKPKKPRAGKSGGDKPMRRRPTEGGKSAGGVKTRDTKTRDTRTRDTKSHDAKPRAARREDDGQLALSFDAPRKPRAEHAGKAAPEKAPPRAKPRKPAREEKLAPPEKTTAFEGERIAKVMARAGVCSRRDAEEWIAAGRVAVNGRVLKSPAVNVKEDDRIEIDGAPMQARERTRLFLFHKPAGLVTTARDEEGRPTVFSYIEEHNPDLPRLVSVGRLDINTEGLLLLTNDGGLARTLELPATGWTRRYRVRAHGDIDQARLDALREGVTIEGVDYAPIEARLERVQGANAWIAMALTEGKNREVKRVMAHLGLDVTRLIRVSYGPFQLGDLNEGVVEEVRLKTLREQLGKTLAEFAGVDFGAPLREATPEEEQEKRQRIEKRPRKHVSVMREERDEKRTKGPRARVTVGATADRKGRAVAVERVTLVRKRPGEEEARTSRNAKRFSAMRSDERKPRDAGGRGKVRGEAREGFNHDRPHDRPRDDRRGAGERATPRFERPRGEEQRRDRPPRDAREGQRFERGARGPTGEGRKFEERGRAPSRERQERGGPRDGGRGFDKPRGERSFEKREGGRNFDRNRDDFGARPPRNREEGAARPPRSRDERGGAPGRGPRKDFEGRARDASGPRKGPPRDGGARSDGPRRGPPKGGASRGGPPRGGSGPRKGPSGKGSSGKGPPRKPRGE